MHRTYRWKGRIVRKSIYERNKKLSAIGKGSRKSVPAVTVPDEHNHQNSDNENCTDEDTPLDKRISNCQEKSAPEISTDQQMSEMSKDDNLVEGRRIVELGWMAKQMTCDFCKKDLSLRNIEHETRIGFASVLHIRCKGCLLLKKISTGKKHDTNTGCRSVFDVNSKIVLGALHSGLGHTHINKLMNVINVPAMASSTFKEREREIGQVIEEMALVSCKQAAAEERELTIKNVDELQKLLPEDLRTGFILPAKPDVLTNSVLTNSEQFPDNNTNDTATVLPHRLQLTDVTSNTNKIATVSSNDVVRIFVSYDMGWSRRGTGRVYDSLNGYSALIGNQSGKVLDYATRNRKCRLCDLGHEKKDHDCRLNFHGTAKAMEADAAVELATESTVLKDLHLEVGVFVGDNDSASICSIRKASDHQIVKHSDMNHTSKGVTNMLYKIDKSKDPNRELSAEAIKYLQRCFVYAASQHKGDSVAMAAAIRNIPFHAFNQHDKCGDWCRYQTDKENYNHTTIIGGFKNSILFEELKALFEKLAQNTDKFAAGASSQANESLNAGMSRKAPKAVCYSMSESADFRFAATVCQKNKGEEYIKHVLKAPRMSPGKHLLEHIKRCTIISKRKSDKSTTREFKLRRRVLQKKRTELRNKKSNAEGETYRSNMGLLEMPAVQNLNDKFDAIAAPALDTNCECHRKAIVFFDIETSGFQISCDVLQIAMQSGSAKFNRYINPNGSISPKASEVHGLTNVHGELHLHGKRVPSLPLRVILAELLQFLQAFEKPCTLVAHNCSFDAPRLLRIINEVSLVQEFRCVIAGFVDTLPLFRKKFPEATSKGQCTLTSLASKTLSLSSEGAHDASYDVFLLEELALFHFATDDLIASSQSFDKVLEARQQAARSKTILGTLAPLEKVVSKLMRVRMANAGISYDILVTTYRSKGKQETIALLQHGINGQAQVIKTKKILNKIVEYLQNC